MYHACVDIKVHCSFPGTIYTESFYKEQDNKPRLCKEIEGTLDDRGGMSMWLRAYSPDLSRVMFTSPQTSRRACCSTIFAAPVHETLLFLIGCSDCPCLSCGLPSAEAWIEASTNTSHNSNSCILCCERYFSYSYVARIVRKSTCYHPDRLRHACMSCGTAILTAKLSFERSLCMVDGLCSVGKIATLNLTIGRVALVAWKGGPECTALQMLQLHESTFRSQEV
jgi:hypothetical protein